MGSLYVLSNTSALGPRSSGGERESAGALDIRVEYVSEGTG